MKPNPDDLLTPNDASKIAGLSADMMRVHADAGHLPSLRTISGRRLFKRADVERFAEQRRAARAA